MSHYSNPTENSALGNVNREWNRLKKVAGGIRRHRLEGTLTYRELCAACRQFGGIYSILLVKAMTEDADPDEKKTPNSAGCSEREM